MAVDKPLNKMSRNTLIRIFDLLGEVLIKQTPVPKQDVGCCHNFTMKIMNDITAVQLLEI